MNRKIIYTGARDARLSAYVVAQRTGKPQMVLLSAYGDLSIVPADQPTTKRVLHVAFPQA